MWLWVALTTASVNLHQQIYILFKQQFLIDVFVQSIGVWVYFSWSNDNVDEYVIFIQNIGNIQQLSFVHLYENMLLTIEGHLLHNSSVQSPKFIAQTFEPFQKINQMCQVNISCPQFRKSSPLCDNYQIGRSLDYLFHPFQTFHVKPLYINECKICYNIFRKDIIHHINVDLSQLINITFIYDFLLYFILICLICLNVGCSSVQKFYYQKACHFSVASSHRINGRYVIEIIDINVFDENVATDLIWFEHVDFASRTDYFSHYHGFQANVNPDIQDNVTFLDQSDIILNARVESDQFYVFRSRKISGIDHHIDSWIYSAHKFFIFVEWV